LTDITLQAGVACLLLLAAAPLYAQSIDGSADWGYGRSTYNAGGEQTATSSFTQGYTVGYRSTLWDPRFLTYAGELTFNKNELTFGRDAGASQQTGFNATANLFPSRPFRATVHGSRGSGGESGHYPESSAMGGGLVLPAGSTPELKTARSEYGVNLQLTAPSLPRVEVSYQDGSATVAAGSLDVVQRQSATQVLVAREGPRLSNTLRYQRNGFDTGISQAFRQQYSDLGYEFVGRATDRTWATARAGRRATYSLFDMPRQVTDIGIDPYHPPSAGEVNLVYGTATLAHQATDGLSTDLSVGYDRERSASGGTSALLAAATTRYRPFTGLTLNGSGIYGNRAQASPGTRVVVLTRGAATGVEYSLTFRAARASAAYEVGGGWNTSDSGVDGRSRLWRGRVEVGTDVLRLVQLNVGYDQGRSFDELLPFGNQWQERTHATARSTLTARVILDATYELASIDRGLAPALFSTRYTQEAVSASFLVTRERRAQFTAGRFLNRSLASDDGNEYIGVAFTGALVGPLRITLTARREHTASVASRLDQDGYYTNGLIEYRVRLFTFSLEHRYTDLALGYGGRLDPLTFTGNQIVLRVGRRFGLAR